MHLKCILEYVLVKLKYIYIKYEDTATYFIQISNVKYSCLKVWLDTKMLYWRGMKIPAHPRHCRDSPEVRFWHISPTMPLLSPALAGPGIQMTTNFATSPAMPLLSPALAGPGIQMTTNYATSPLCPCYLQP